MTMPGVRHGADNAEKLSTLIKQRPRNDGSMARWHKDFIDSSSWLELYPGCDFLTPSLIWSAANLDKRDKTWFDDLWTDEACVRSRDHGLVIKTHRSAELSGLMRLMPKNKGFRVINCEEWLRSRNKQYDVGLYQTQPDKKLFDFDVAELLMKGQDEFLDQMKSAYAFFSLDDHWRVLPNLITWRKIYLTWLLIGDLDKSEIIAEDYGDLVNISNN